MTNRVFESEKDDAITLLTKYGFLSAGFAFACEEHAAEGVAFPLRYLVRVTYRGVEKTYQGGHGLAWVGQFEDDLCAGWDGRAIGQPKR